MNEVLFNNEVSEAVAAELISTNAFNITSSGDRTTWRTWKSGIVAPVYCDTRRIYSYPSSRHRILSAMVACVREHYPDISAAIGMSTAGIGWAFGTATFLNLPSGYVRSTPKSHGTGKLIEFNNPFSKKVVLIDDLVASGGSIKNAIDLLESEGLEVAGVVSVVNWQFQHMFDTLKGYKIKAITSYPSILRVLKANGAISQNQYEDLLKFYQSPKNHVWQCDEYKTLAGAA